MEIICTRPNCPHPQNSFPDLDESGKLKTVQQKYCISCGMPLILAGRYLPTKLLGQGGFGAAFLAKDRFTPTMRECVVKQFQPSGNLTGKQLEIAENLFEREAIVLERLGNKHSQIPDLFAFFPLIVPSIHQDKQEQYFYLAQEFINGQDLEQELKIKGAFSEGEVRFVLVEILKVLEFVHNNNSIHRDIKPSNIMRDGEGKLYLLDFGAVKEVTATAGSASGRSTGIYSPGYAPPEQMSGSQVFPATDLYALAVTCICLLSGKQPDELYDPYNNCWDWKSKTPHISDDLAQLFDIMLSSSVKNRFQSATEILDLLLNPQLISTPQPSISQPPISQPPISQPPISQPPISQPPIQPSVNNPPPIIPPIQSQSIAPQFSLLEVIGSSGFTGFEGALLAIALNSLLGITAISVGVWGIIIGVIIFLQYRRIIERKDLPILAILSVLIMLIPALHNSAGFLPSLLIALFAGAGAIAVMTLFRLIYQLLARML
jgi:serine/threonine protein kinase